MRNCIHGRLKRECLDCDEREQLLKDLERSARDWEIIRNKSFGTRERIWSQDSDYEDIGVKSHVYHPAT